MRFRLADEDRAKLGIEQEWLDGVDLDKITLADGELLDAHGYPGDQFLEEIGGTPMVRDGQPVMVPVLDDDGQPVVDGDKPRMRQRRTRPFRVHRALMWLALRRAGVEVPLDGFNVSFTSIQFDHSSEPPAGKGPRAATPRSAKSANGTRSRSSRSSGSSRGSSSS